MWSTQRCLTNYLRRIVAPPCASPGCTSTDMDLISCHGGVIRIGVIWLSMGLIPHTGAQTHIFFPYLSRQYSIHLLLFPRCSTSSVAELFFGGLWGSCSLLVKAASQLHWTGLCLNVSPPELKGCLFFFTPHEPFRHRLQITLSARCRKLPPSFSPFLPRYHLTFFIHFCCFHLFSLSLSHLPSPLSPRLGGRVCFADLPGGKVQQLYSRKKKRRKMQHGKDTEIIFVFFTEKMTISELVPGISVSSDAFRLFFSFQKSRSLKPVYSHAAEMHSTCSTGGRHSRNAAECSPDFRRILFRGQKLYFS